MVEFVNPDGSSWVGNFASGWITGQRAIHSELGSAAIVIVADGAGYIVDADEKRLIREIVGGIHYIRFVSELNAVIVSNGLWFEAFNAHQAIWRTRRLSWNYIRHVIFSDMALTGEADDPMGDDWVSFRVDLSSGKVEGGSYNGPPM